MGKKPRAKMPISQRAKQFAPFQAVGGLDEALRRAEEEHRRALEEENVIRIKNDEGESNEGEEGAEDEV